MNYVITKNDKAIEYYTQVYGEQKITSKLRDNDCIAVPGMHTEQGMVFEDDTIDFMKYCLQNDPNHKYALAVDGDIPLNSQHSADILIPLLIIAENGMLPVILNLLSSYIFNRIANRKHESHDIKVSIMVIDGDRNTRIDYSGPADGFTKVAEDIKGIITE